MLRNAALRSGAGQARLASAIPFAITAATKMLRAGASHKSACSQKRREDFDGQYARSRHRSGISGRPGGDARRLRGAGGNPRPAADPGLARRPQGDCRENSGRTERCGAWSRRQDVCLQQRRLHLDTYPQRDHAGTAARRLSRRLDPARRHAVAARSRPSSPSAASMACAGRTISSSTSMAGCGSPNSASAGTATWISAASTT